MFTQGQIVSFPAPENPFRTCTGTVVRDTPVTDLFVEVTVVSGHVAEKVYAIPTSDVTV